MTRNRARKKGQNLIRNGGAFEQGVSDEKACENKEAKFHQKWKCFAAACF